jgi:hypothetical protein
MSGWLYIHLNLLDFGGAGLDRTAANPGSHQMRGSGG